MYKYRDCVAGDGNHITVVGLGYGVFLQNGGGVPSLLKV